MLHLARAGRPLCGQWRYWPLEPILAQGHGRANHQRPGQIPCPPPPRKQLKDALKSRKLARRSGHPVTGRPHPDPDGWELTVGIEVHAALNTARKLFSDALTTDHENDVRTEPNTHVAPFDAAIPGTQPVFQVATLIPAIRAAIALGCQVQRKSSWDRKHYFYRDQPNGYQITQHYEPLAKDGAIRVQGEQGTTTIGIKQLQLEQDTAKSTSQGSRHLLDLNRVSHPLIEIVTLPHITSPGLAADVVRKIASLLRAVDACVGGMETGALRADVNVSVRRRGTTGRNQSYAGVDGLGVRTEIKNLSSYKAVEDAVTAERDRQIAVLEAGGHIECETRGWAVASSQTTRLRGKEGVVDYRYMPEPDLGAVHLDPQLIEHLRDTLPELPDATVRRIVDDFGLSEVDARALLIQDDGDRLEFLAEAVGIMAARTQSGLTRQHMGRIAGNWTLHELGGLLTSDRAGWADRTITVEQFADLLVAILDKQVTAGTAKSLLRRAYKGEFIAGTIGDIIDDECLRLRAISDDEYRDLARAVLNDHRDLVETIRNGGDRRKAMFLVGQMMRRADQGSIEAVKAKEIVETMLGEESG